MQHIKFHNRNVNTFTNIKQKPYSGLKELILFKNIYIYKFFLIKVPLKPLFLTCLPNTVLFTTTKSKLTRFILLIITRKLLLVQLILRIIQTVIRVQNTQSIRNIPRSPIIGHLIRAQLLERIIHGAKILRKMRVIIHTFIHTMSVQILRHRQLNRRRITIHVLRTAVIFSLEVRQHALTLFLASYDRPRRVLQDVRGSRFRPRTTVLFLDRQAFTVRFAAF